jgi:hypothetical protein
MYNTKKKRSLQHLRLKNAFINMMTQLDRDIEKQLMKFLAF